MGQGFYTAFVYGIFLDDAQKERLDEMHVLWRDRVSAWGTLRLKSSYESEPCWIGFFLADNDGNLNTGYDPSGTDVYPQLGVSMYRKSFRLRDLDSFLEDGKPGLLQACANAWVEVRAEVSGVLVLPDADILVVNDWD